MPGFGFSDLDRSFGFGAPQKVNPIGPYLPTANQVAEKFTDEQDDKPLLFKLLEIPNRLLFGQSIQGFLEGVGSGGVGEGLRKAFVNNPVFQLFEAIPGVDGLVEDTNFSKIRQAFGQTNTDSGIANFFINLGGELVTSPLELLWAPFGKFATAGKAGKYLKGAVRFTPNAEDYRSLVETVTQDGPVRRALLAFKIPFSEKGFVYQAPATLDIPLAHTLDAMTRFLNANPATKYIADLFRSTSLKSPDRGKRVYAQEALEAKDKAGREFDSMINALISKFTREHGYMDAHSQLGVITYAELGLTGVDNAADIRKIVAEGADAAKAQGRRLAKLRSVDPADENFKKLYQELVDDAANFRKTGDTGTLEESIREYATRYKNVALPLEVIDLIKSTKASRPELQRYLRSNVDIWDYEAYARQGKEAATNRALEGLGDPLPTDRVTARGIEAFGQDPGLEAVSKLNTRDSLIKFIDELQQTQGVDILTKISASAEAFADVYKRIGIADMSKGIITSMLEFAVPREISPGVRDAIDAQFAKFYQGRKFSQMTIFEANQYILENGTKATNYRPLKMFSADPKEETVGGILGRIFDGEFIRGLRKQGLDDPQIEAAAEFFATNPYSLLKRAQERSRALHEKSAVYEHLLDPRGQFVIDSTKPFDADKNVEHFNKKRTGWYVPETKDGVPRYHKATGVSAQEMHTATLGANDVARAHFANQQVDDWVEKSLDHIANEYDLAKQNVDQARTVRDTKVGHVQEVAARLEAASNVTLEDFVAGGSKKVNLKRAQAVSIDDPIVSGSPLAKNLQNQAEMTKLQSAYDDIVAAQLGVTGTTTKEAKALARQRVKDEIEQAAAKEAAGAIDQSVDEVIGQFDRFESVAAKNQKLATAYNQALKDMEFLREARKGPNRRTKDLPTLKDAQTEMSQLKRALMKSRKELNAAIQEIRPGTSKGLLDETPVDVVLERNARKVLDSIEARLNFLESPEALPAFTRYKAISLNEDFAKQLGKLKQEESVLRSNMRSKVQELREEMRELRKAGTQEVDTLAKKAVAENQERLGSVRSKKRLTKDAIKDIKNKERTEADLIDDLRLFVRERRHGVLDLDKLRNEHPKLYERLTQRKTGTIRWMTKEDGQAIFGEGGFIDKLYKVPEYAKSLSVLDEVNTIWKAITVLPPVFLQGRIRDVISSILMYGINGGKMVSYSGFKDANKVMGLFDTAKGTDLLSAVRQGIDDPRLKEVLELGTDEFGAPRNLTVGEFLQQAQSNGVVDGGLLQEVFEFTGENTWRNQPGYKEVGFGKYVKRFREIITDNKFMKVGGNLVEGTDNFVKIAAYITELRKGRTMGEAAMEIKKWIYNPSRVDLSSFERYALRRFLPFYTFTKFAITSTVEAAMAKPASITWIEKVRENIRRASGMTEGEFEQFIPEFIQDNMGIPVTSPEEAKKTGQFGVGLFGGLVLSTDLLKLADAIVDTVSGNETAGGVSDYIGEKLTPALKVPLQELVNRSFFAQSKLERFEGERVEYMGVPMPVWARETLRSIRFLNEVDHLNIFNFADVNRIISLQGAVDRPQNLSLGQRLTGSAFTPIPIARVYNVNLELQARRSKAEQERKLSLLKHELKTQVQRGNPSTKDQNITTLQDLIADAQARIAIREQAEQRLNIDTERRR